jgi:hypothetical protein
VPTLETTFRVDGTLTNPTSVVMSDPTNTYGVRRQDTQAVVVANNTAMTNVSTGVYRHTFTAPAAGLTYEWYVEVVYNGITYHSEKEFVDKDPYAGTYWTWTGIKNEIGQVNAEIVSQLDNDVTTADMARVAVDGEIADAVVNRRARLGGYTVPIADTIQDFLLVRRAANLYASFLLARHRQWFDRTGPEQEKLVGLEAEAKELLDALFGPDPGGIDGEEEADTDRVGDFQFITIDRGVCPADNDSFAEFAQD